MENENISKENEQTPQIDNIGRDEQLLRETLRKEREEIIRAKMKSEIFTKTAQSTIEAQDEELKIVSRKLVELDNETEQLEKVTENETHNKMIIANDFENIRKITLMYDEQLSVIKKTLEEIEVKTINIEESKSKSLKQVESFLENQKIREEALEKEIYVAQTLMENEISNSNKSFEERVLKLDKLKEESMNLNEESKELLKIIEEKEICKMQLENKLEETQLQKHSVVNELEKMREKIFEIRKEFEEEKSMEKEKLNAFKFKISSESEEDEKQQKIFEELREKHKQLDDQVTEAEAEIKVLDAEKTELRKIIVDKEKKMNEQIAKNSSVRQENNLIIEQLKNTQNNFIKKLEQIENENADLLKHLEVVQDKVKTSITELQIAQQNNAVELKKLDELMQKVEENSFKHENQIKDYEKKIQEVKFSRKEKCNTNERLNNLIENLEKRIAEDKAKIQVTLNEKTSILVKHTSTYKNCKETLESEKTKLQTINSELEKVTVTAELDPQLPKKKMDRINKMEKQIKNYEDEMNAIRKMDNENHKKNKKLLEESVKTSLDRINDLKIMKDNLQDQLEQIMKEIMDAAQKIEVKNEEKEIQTFKSPILPTRSKPTFISSTPKGVLKKPVENKPEIEEPTENSATDVEEDFKKIFPLTQKTDEQKLQSQKIKQPMNVNLWPTDNETTDDSSVNKKISSTQKPIEVVDLLGKPKISSTQSKKLPSLWPTDIEESDDSFRQKNVPFTQKNIPLTQKSEKKASVYDFNEDVDLFGDEEPAKFVHFQSKKKTLTQKSDKKPDLTQKMSLCDIKEEDNLFESLKASTHISPKKTKPDKFDPSKPRKRMAIDFFATENEESDDSFFGKLNKSKKIQEKLKPAPKEASVINLIDTSISE